MLKSKLKTSIGKQTSMGVSNQRVDEPAKPAALPGSAPVLAATLASGQTSVERSVAGAAPAPIFKLATEIAPSKPKMFSTDAQLQERFAMVAEQLEDESEVGRGKWAAQIVRIHQRVQADPELVTALSEEALHLYFKASDKLSNTAAGVAISKRLTQKRAEDSLAKMQAEAAEMAAKAAEAASMVGDDLEWD